MSGSVTCRNKHHRHEKGHLIWLQAHRPQLLTEIKHGVQQRAHAKGPQRCQRVRLSVEEGHRPLLGVKQGAEPHHQNLWAEPRAAQHREKGSQQTRKETFRRPEHAPSWKVPGRCPIWAAWPGHAGWESGSLGCSSRTPLLLWQRGWSTGRRTPTPPDWSGWPEPRDMSWGDTPVGWRREGIRWSVTDFLFFLWPATSHQSLTQSTTKDKSHQDFGSSV